MKTSVTVESGNNSIEQQSKFTPPYLQKEAKLDVTETSDGTSTTYSFILTAYTRDDSNEKIVCYAELYTMISPDDPVLITLHEISPGTYVGTYSITSETAPVEAPVAMVKGYWDKVPENTYYQEAFAVYAP